MGRESYGREWIWKVLAIVLTVFLGGALMIFWFTENREAQAMQDANAEMEQELRPLELERHKLQQELNGLQTEYSQNVQGKGILMLLFTNLDEGIYTEIYPIMKKFGHAGVVTLSENCYPGADGAMSREQFRELMDAGWECCLRWEGETDADDWVRSSSRLARRAGVVCPKAVYFPGDTYDSEVEEFLIEKEFLTAVHHGEGESSLIVSGIEGGIWNPGAMGWQQRGASKLLDETVEKKGNLIFTIGTDFSAEEYDRDSYIAMLERADAYCEDDNLKVMTLSQAREYRQGLENGEEDFTEKYNERKADVETRLEDLDQKIDEIIRKYGKIR